LVYSPPRNSGISTKNAKDPMFKALMGHGLPWRMTFSPGLGLDDTLRRLGFTDSDLPGRFP